MWTATVSLATFAGNFFHVLPDIMCSANIRMTKNTCVAIVKSIVCMTIVSQWKTIFLNTIRWKCRQSIERMDVSFVQYVPSRWLVLVRWSDIFPIMIRIVRICVVFRNARGHLRMRMRWWVIEWLFIRKLWNVRCAWKASIDRSCYGNNNILASRLSTCNYLLIRLQVARKIA